MRVRAQHNPEKLAEVDTLLAKYGEQKLLSMVRKKYIHDPVRKKCAKSGCPAAQNCARKHRQTAAPKPAAVRKSSEGSPRVCVQAAREEIEAIYAVSRHPLPEFFTMNDNRRM